jgi:hypothetical protein
MSELPKGFSDHCQLGNGLVSPHPENNLQISE